LALGFAGVLIVLGFWQAEASNLTGQLMCAVAAFCYGIAIPYIKRFVTGRAGISGVALAAMQVIVGTVASTAAALVLAGPPAAPTTWGWDVLGSVLALGVFGSGIAFALNMRVIKVAGASAAAYVTYLVPVVAVILGILVLHETLTWNLPVGAAIVLFGVAVAQGVFARKRPAPPQAPQPEWDAVQDNNSSTGQVLTTR
jgi:drug/metabolite transporter (DMT)-like permease